MSNSTRETDNRKIANPQDGENLLQSLKQNKEAGRKSRKPTLRKTMNRNDTIAPSTDHLLTQTFRMLCSATLTNLCIGCGIYSTGASPWRLCWLTGCLQGMCNRVCQWDLGILRDILTGQLHSTTMISTTLIEPTNRCPGRRGVLKLSWLIWRIFWAKLIWTDWELVCAF